jgi:hypothetical protein
LANALNGGRRLRPDPASVLGTLAVVADDHRPSRWVIDFTAGTITQGDGDVDGVLTGSVEDLTALVCGAENAGALLRSGRVRHVVPTGEERRRTDVPIMVSRVVQALRSDGVGV